MHDGSYDNEYYRKSRNAFSVLLDLKVLANWLPSKPTLSAKAFLATEQHFPGIGNGVLQDILFAAQIHPKRDRKANRPGGDNLLFAVVSVLRDDRPWRAGYRKDCSFCGYETKMSRHTLRQAVRSAVGNKKKPIWRLGLLLPNLSTDSD